MKKTLAIVVLLCITLGAQAQLLWKVSGNGLDRPSYVFGTHHLAPLSIKDSIASLQQVIDRTEQVYGEIIMGDSISPEAVMVMQRARRYYPEKSLYTGGI